LILNELLFIDYVLSYVMVLIVQLRWVNRWSFGNHLLGVILIQIYVWLPELLRGMLWVKLASWALLLNHLHCLLCLRSLLLLYLIRRWQKCILLKLIFIVR